MEEGHLVHKLEDYRDDDDRQHRNDNKSNNNLKLHYKINHQLSDEWESKSR